MKVYDPDQITLTFAGIPVQGFADGEFVRVEDESDRFADVVGTDGEVTRSKSNDFRATVTIILMQTSESNDLLAAVANLDEQNSNGAGVGSFFLRDRQGRLLIRAAEAWISRRPDISRGREAGSQEWTIRLARAQRFEGGN